MDGDTQGDRIRALFENAEGGIAVIAPFIKISALRSLLEVIPASSHLRCVSRWLPREIAAGVSDPEILDLLEARGNFSLSLVDRLHAKLYIAGDRCLAGSANVTLAGLGEVGDHSNIEILVETTIDDPGISATLEEIAQAERPATRNIAQIARILADNLAKPTTLAVSSEMPWFPRSHRPEHVYRFYTHAPSGYVGVADQILLADLAGSNLQPGLDEGEFQIEIRSLLSKIPIAEVLLGASEDTTFTRADASSYLETIASEDFSVNDLWRAFANWMDYFFSDKIMKQEIVEIALRRARLLD